MCVVIRRSGEIRSMYSLTLNLSRAGSGNGSWWMVIPGGGGGGGGVSSLNCCLCVLVIERMQSSDTCGILRIVVLTEVGV